MRLWLLVRSTAGWSPSQTSAASPAPAASSYQCLPEAMWGSKRIAAECLYTEVVSGNACSARTTCIASCVGCTMVELIKTHTMYLCERMARKSQFVGGGRSQLEQLSVLSSTCTICVRHRMTSSCTSSSELFSMISTNGFKNSLWNW